MKSFFKKKAVKVVLIILAILIAVAVTFTIIRKNKTKEMAESFTYTRTVTLSKSSLEETVVSSGTIESQTTSTISASVNNASISKINYGVGDYVKEGDVIVELDTSNLYKQINKQSDKVNDQEESLQDRYDEAEDSYDDAEKEYKSAKSARNDAANKYSSASAAIEEYLNDYNEKTSLVDEAYKNSFEDEDVVITKTEHGYEMAPDIYEYATKVSDQTVALEKLNNAKQAYDYDNLQKAYQEAENKYEQIKSQYKQAESTYESAKDALDDGVDTDSLDELYDTVSDYQLKAKSSGQITSINAVLGSNATGTLATIQDTSKLKISLTIDEYDILKIELGQKAKIETDASDTVYEGVVSQISPTASSGGMGSSGGFEIEVQVTSEDVSKLLIGMNAEVTIIISSGDENFLVPIDAVEDKADGTSVIYVENADGEFEEVKVNKGETNGYYVEIFANELKEGMKVRASANADEAQVTSEDFTGDFDSNSFEPGGFDMGGGGFPGGGSMPSGGGSFPGGQGGPGGR
ncbi:MAG: HlyD family efflux transporter periplasmic adaptor subunit [Erysipelotrichaceae bacterium]|nr:HlyD family efflux transporter periplasmic adaptor subunit [Erysipelotrichaceae bacterium]